MHVHLYRAFRCLQGSVLFAFHEFGPTDSGFEDPPLEVSIVPSDAPLDAAAVNGPTVTVESFKPDVAGVYDALYVPWESTKDRL